MNNRFFGDICFNSGWETSIDIWYNKKKYNITVSADAFYEKDGITEQQENSYIDFLRSKEEILTKIEERITGLNDGKNYTPSLMKFKRDGEYAMIFDDTTDPEAGIAVVLPNLEIYAVDQYL